MSNNFQKMLLEKMKANKERRDFLDKELEELDINKTKKSKKRSKSPVSITEVPKDEGLTKQDLEDLKYWEDKMKKNDEKTKEYRETGKIDGKKVPLSKRNQVENELMNNSINWRRQIQEINFRPELKKITKEIKNAYKAGEITKEERDTMIRGSKNSLSNELELRRRVLEKEKNKKPYNEVKQRDINDLKQKILKESPEDFDEYNKGDDYLNMNDYDNAKKIFLKLYKKSIKSPYYNSIIGSYYTGDEGEEPKSKPIKEKKTYKEKNIMKARSDLKKKGDKYTVDTEMKVSKNLDNKVKKVLKKSVENALENELGDIKGKGVKKIILDLDSSDDEKPKRKRGRPKKST